MKYKLINNHGYTLYLVMVILSIIAILFSVTSIKLHNVNISVKSDVNKAKAKLLAESGIIRTEYFLNGGDGHKQNWEAEKYNEQVSSGDSICLNVERFGLFSRVQSTGKVKSTTCAIENLFGRSIPSLLEPTLTLTGHIGGLIIQEGSSVAGKIVLHHGYVYSRKKGQPLRDYISRLKLRESDVLPFDTLAIPEIFNRYATERETHLKKDQAFGSLLLDGGNDSLCNNCVLTIQGDCTIRTSNCRNATIFIKGICTIEEEAALFASSFFADRVIINGGKSEASLFFSEKPILIKNGLHNSQFMAGDSIVIKKEVSFGPMTVITGVRREYKKDSTVSVDGGIYCEKGSGINATIICVAENGVNRNSMSPSVKIGDNSKITGTIITDGDCVFYRSRLAGHLWARSIVVKNEKGMFTNYLFGSQLVLSVEENPFPMLGEPPLRIMVARGSGLPQYERKK